MHGMHLSWQDHQRSRLLGGPLTRNSDMAEAGSLCGGGSSVQRQRRAGKCLVAKNIMANMHER